jgi:altronate hydrolase
MDNLNPQDIKIHVVAKSVTPRGEPIALNEVAVLLNPHDDVAIARRPLGKGVILQLPAESGPGERVEVRQRIPSGHKVALHDVEQGQAVRRYGSIIGFATQPIHVGEHVHSHNLAVGELHQEYEYSVDVQPPEFVQPEQRRTFMGYRRPDGKAGTRNYIAVIGSVNCSASTVRFITRRFTPEVLRDYPNIDGVIGLTHKNGCAMRIGGPAIKQLQRVLAGMALNPNIGAYLLVGLGCESNQIQEMIANMELEYGKRGQWKRPLFLTIQENHGIASTVEAAAGMISKLLPEVNDVQREPLPIS